MLRLDPVLAGTVAMLGSAWDGLADFAVGGIVQRSRGTARRWVRWGTLPLGLSFCALYAAPLALPGAAALAALVAQIAFRTCYALVNVSYSAWSVRVAPDSGARATVAGWRMLFGAAAAILVTLVTQHWAGTAHGSPTAPRGFLAASALFAVIATANLLLLVRAIDDAPDDGPAPRPRSTFACLRALAGNRAFATLNAAALATAMGGTLLMRSVLYYFSYVVGDAAGGSRALALMGVAAVAAVPLWMLVARRHGVRRAWLAGAAAALLFCGAFALSGTRGAVAAGLFLIAMQATLTCFSFGFWAMLPDTLDRQGAPAEDGLAAIGFGVAALVQKLGMGLAAWLIGAAYQLAGYCEGAAATARTQAGISWMMILGPALCIAASLPLMAANPLRHRRG